jgi:CheY-like chemotaxis protein
MMPGHKDHAEAAMRILVVDDSPDVLGFMRIGLEGAGYVVDVAADGRQALTLQREHGADLMITDIFMPETDGLEVIQAMRSDFPAARIIAMSSRIEYLQVARLLGIELTMAKPFTTSRLLRVVGTALQGKPSEAPPPAGCRH